MKCGSCLLVNEFLKVYSRPRRIWKQEGDVRSKINSKQNSEQKTKNKKKNNFYLCNVCLTHSRYSFSSHHPVLFQCIVLEIYLGTEVEKVGGKSIKEERRAKLFFVNKLCQKNF